MLDIFGPMFEAMLQGEMSGYLGYESNDHSSNTKGDRRNGYTENREFRASENQDAP